VVIHRVNLAAYSPVGFPCSFLPVASEEVPL